jgi:hypothetical protein
MQLAWKPWSRPRLHQHLYDLLNRPTTTVTARTKLRGFMADVVFDTRWPPQNVKIEIDMNNAEPIHTIIHELLHVVLSETVCGKFDSSLEEVVILSLDEYIYNWVKASPKRLAKWQKLLEAKLAETAGEPLSQEDMAHDEN